MNISIGEPFVPESRKSLKNSCKKIHHWIETQKAPSTFGLDLTPDKVNNHARLNEYRKKMEQHNTSDSSDLTIKGDERNMIVLKNGYFDSSCSTISIPKKSKKEGAVLYSSSDSVDTATYIRQNQKKYTKTSKYKTRKINSITKKTSNEKISPDIRSTSKINLKLNKIKTSNCSRSEATAAEHSIKSPDIPETISQINKSLLQSIVIPAATLKTTDCKTDVIDKYIQKEGDSFLLNSNTTTNQNINHTDPIEFLASFLTKCCTKINESSRSIDNKNKKVIDKCSKGKGLKDTCSKKQTAFSNQITTDNDTFQINLLNKEFPLPMQKSHKRNVLPNSKTLAGKNMKRNLDTTYVMQSISGKKVLYDDQLRPLNTSYERVASLADFAHVM